MLSLSESNACSIDIPHVEKVFCREALKVGEREVAAARISRLEQTNTAYRERIKALRER